MKKLFENVDGNRFKLISESIEESEPKSSLVRKGLKKVFSEGEKEYSYKRLEGVGLGYIRNVSDAKKCALQEARELALEFGYKDNEEESKFVKENGHGESDMSNPKEAREVQIGKEILNIASKYGLRTSQHDLPEEVSKAGFDRIGKLAQELINIHDSNAVIKPGTGGTLYKRGSIY
jgi:hypothetical protein